MLSGVRRSVIVVFEFIAPLTTGMPCCPQRTVSGACFTADRSERFALWRRWNDGEVLGFLLMNPSIADEERLDPTLKRCSKWAQRLGYGGMEIVNCWPLVSTNPRGLEQHDHAPSRARNEAHIRDLAKRTKLVLGCGDLFASAWMRPLAVPALRGFISALDGLTVYSLAVTENGSPRHPLARGKAHIPSSAVPRPYSIEMLLERLEGSRPRE